MSSEQHRGHQGYFTSLQTFKIPPTFNFRTSYSCRLWSLRKWNVVRTQYWAILPFTINPATLTPMTTLWPTTVKCYSSSTARPNLNFIIVTFLTCVLSYNDNHQFPKKIANKYFKRLHWLLKGKLVCITWSYSFNVW